MKYEFIIKIEGKQYEKGRGRLVIMLGCFTVALLIDMVYSPRTALSMLVPISFILYRLKSLRAEKNYFTDAVCTLEVKQEAMELSIQSTQSKLCSCYLIQFADIDSFIMEDREVHIEFIDDNKRHQNIDFYIMAKDVLCWKEIMKDITS